MGLNGAQLGLNRAQLGLNGAQLGLNGLNWGSIGLNWGSMGLNGAQWGSMGLNRLIILGKNCTKHNCNSLGEPAAIDVIIYDICISFFTSSV